MNSAGTIAYPSNYDQTNAELWTVLDPNMKLVTNIQNYTVLYPVNFGGKEIRNNDSTKDYVIDLNNNVAELSDKNYFNGKVKSVKFIGGALACDQNISGGVIDVSDESLVRLDGTSNDKVYMPDFDGSKVSTSLTSAIAEGTIKLENNNETAIIDGKYIALVGHTSKGRSGQIKYDLRPEKSDYKSLKTLVIRNCTFSNATVEVTGRSIHLIVENCDFYNIKGNAPIQYGAYLCSDHSYEIRNNNFYNVQKGLNLGLPYTSDPQRKSIIENNTFDFDETVTDKDQWKCNLLQLCLTTPSEFEKQDANEKVLIKNNTLKNGKAIINFHSAVSIKAAERYYKTLTVDSSVEDDKANPEIAKLQEFYEPTTFAEYLGKSIKFEANKWPDGIDKVSFDPDTANDVGIGTQRNISGPYHETDVKYSRLTKENVYKYAEDLTSAYKQYVN